MVVNFSLAVNSYRNSPEGDQIQETEWFRVSCWNKTAESVNQFLQKGQRCFVEGRFRSSNYTANDGTQRQSNEVTAFRVIFLDRSTANVSEESTTNENNSSQTTQPTEVKENIVETNQNDETDDVEELPW
jgi:single-strand DNA-binding protein